MTAKTVHGDTKRAIEFLRRWPTAYPHLVAIRIDDQTHKGSAPEGRAFTQADLVDGGAVEKWINERQGKANIYFSVNGLTTALNKKAEKTDVSKVVAFQVDIDVPAGEDQAAFAEQIIEQMRAFKPEPSVIIMSGGGAQAFWLLRPDDRLKIDGDPAKAEAAECYTRGLEDAFSKLGLGKVDACHNVDRIMRLPGTINVPDASKIAKGRKRALAELVHFTDVTHPISAFTPAEPKSKSSAKKQNAKKPVTPLPHYEVIGVDDPRLSKLTAKWKEIGFLGKVDGKYGDDRSRAVLAFATACFRYGIPEDVTASCLMTWKIGQHIRDQRDVMRALNRTLERAKACVATADPMEMIDQQAVAPIIEPVDLWGNFPPPKLPRGLLPKLIEDYAFTTRANMGADPGGVAMAALATCAAATPDSIKLQMKKHSDDWQEAARLWVGLVGLPSTKKSPIISAAVKPLETVDGALVKQYGYAMDAYKKLDADERKATEPPPQRRLRLGDTTIEAAQEVMVGSPEGVLLHQDELSGWFGSMDKYGGNRGAAKDRGFWLQSYNGGEYALNRVGRGVALIPNLSVSVLGGIQPDVIRRLAAEGGDDGFLQRLLLIVLSPAVVGQDVVTPPDGSAYARLVKRLPELMRPRECEMGEPISLRFDEGAQSLREQLERKHLDLTHWEAINPKLASHIGKYDGLFGRLCVLWHCIEHSEEDRLPPEVTEATARRVGDFLHKFILLHAIAFYSGILNLADDHDRLAAVAGYILARKLEVVTNRDIQRGDRTMRKLSKRDTETVFEQLEAFGWLSSGDRRGQWKVNPLVHQRFTERGRQEADRRAATRELINAQAGGAPAHAPQ